MFRKILYSSIGAFIVVGILGILSLSGCASKPVSVQGALAADTAVAPAAPAPAPATDPLSKLNAFTIGDLQQAEAIATAQGDTIAQACYPALIQFVGSLPHGDTAKPIGAFSAFQAARSTRLALTGGVPVSLKLACSPLLMDEQQFLIKLGVIASGAAITGGALPLALPALPALP